MDTYAYHRVNDMSDTKKETDTFPSDVQAAKPSSRITADGSPQEAMMPDTAPALPGALEYDYTNFYFGAGDDAFALLGPFDEWWTQVKPSGYYLYELPLMSAPSTRVSVKDTKTVAAVLLQLTPPQQYPTVVTPGTVCL